VIQPDTNAATRNTVLLVILLSLTFDSGSQKVVFEIGDENRK
jgi:hypothetical protein